MQPSAVELVIPRRRHRQHVEHLHARALGVEWGLELFDLLQVVQVQWPAVSCEYHALEWPALEQAARSGQQGGGLAHVSRAPLVGDGPAVGRLQSLQRHLAGDEALLEHAAMAHIVIDGFFAFDANGGEVVEDD